MIITKKHIGILIAILTAFIAAAALYHNFQVKQTIAQTDFKIILDAGHGA